MDLYFKPKVNFGLVFLYMIIFSTLSIGIINNYVAGDRLVYKVAYDQLSEYSFFDAVKFYYVYFSAPDVAWLIFAYLFSILSLDFDIFSFVISILVFYGFFLVAIKHIKYRPLYNIFIFFLFINIQFLAIYFSSQRLAIAIFFLCLAFCSDNNFKRLSFIISSVLGHFTVIFIYLISFFGAIRNKVNRGRTKLLLPLILMIVIFMAFNFRELILVKVSHYSEISNGGVPKNLLKYLPVPFIVYFVNRKNFDLIINCFIIAVLLFFDEERVFQLGYLYATWSIFTSHSRRAVFVALAFNIIPTIRGVEYVIGVFVRGNGLDPQNFGWLTL